MASTLSYSLRGSRDGTFVIRYEGTIITEIPISTLKEAIKLTKSSLTTDYSAYHKYLVDELQRRVSEH